MVLDDSAAIVTGVANWDVIVTKQTKPRETLHALRYLVGRNHGASMRDFAAMRSRIDGDPDGGKC